MGFDCCGLATRSSSVPGAMIPDSARRDSSTDSRCCRAVKSVEEAHPVLLDPDILRSAHTPHTRRAPSGTDSRSRSVLFDLPADTLIVPRGTRPARKPRHHLSFSFHNLHSRRILSCDSLFVTLDLPTLISGSSQPYKARPEEVTTLTVSDTRCNSAPASSSSPSALQPPPWSVRHLVLFLDQ